MNSRRAINKKCFGAYGNVWLTFDDTKVVQKPPALGWSRQNPTKLSARHPPTEQRELGWEWNAAANPLLCRQRMQSGALPPAWHHLRGDRWHRGVGNKRGVLQASAVGVPASSYSAAAGLDPVALGLCCWICFGWSVSFWVCTCIVKIRILRSSWTSCTGLTSHRDLQEE